MIQLLGYLACALLCYQLHTILINVLFRQTIAHTTVQREPLTSVLIPARNEEETIALLLESLRTMRTSNIEILVYNDQSTDATEQVVQRCAALDSRIRMIETTALPLGWLGKPHACYELAKQARGEYLLFLDADVVLSGTIIPDAVAYAQKKHLALLSLCPKQLLLTSGEKQTVPLMNYILVTLLPLIFVRVSPFTSHAAANGQCMLFEASTYKAVEPHQHQHYSAVEDIAIARLYKRSKLRTACVIGEERVQCRMYNSYENALQGFSKNIFVLFGNKPILAFAFWALTSFGIIPLVLFNIPLAIAYALGVLLIQVLYALVCKQEIFTTIVNFPATMLFMVRVLLKAWQEKQQRQCIWKGRNIY